MAPLIMQQALAMGGLTQIELLWIEKRAETWIRFGHIAKEQIIDDTRRVVNFAPNSVFALVHWAANDYGTILSQLDILRAVTPGEPYVAVSDVTPGADILLHVSRWPKVQKVLQIIDVIEALTFSPNSARRTRSLPIAAAPIASSPTRRWRRCARAVQGAPPGRRPAGVARRRVSGRHWQRISAGRRSQETPCRSAPLRPVDRCA